MLFCLWVCCVGAVGFCINVFEVGLVQLWDLCFGFIWFACFAGYVWWLCWLYYAGCFLSGFAWAVRGFVCYDCFYFWFDWSFCICLCLLVVWLCLRLTLWWLCGVVWIIIVCVECCWLVLFASVGLLGRFVLIADCLLLLFCLRVGLELLVVCYVCVDCCAPTESLL